jgi:RNA polymerase sigma factor (sigma-70 family)
MTAEQDALDEFCRREHRRLVGALSLYCGDPAVAEEVAQEALYRACRRWSQVSQMAAPGAWVHRVAINLANSSYRRRRVERRARDRQRAPAAWEDDLVAAVAVRQAVAALPARQRAALVVRHYGGFTVAETAALLGVTEGAVKQLTHRAVTALRVALPQGDSPGVPDAR